MIPLFLCTSMPARSRRQVQIPINTTGLSTPRSQLLLLFRHNRDGAVGTGVRSSWKSLKHADLNSKNQKCSPFCKSCRSPDPPCKPPTTDDGLDSTSMSLIVNNPRFGRGQSCPSSQLKRQDSQQNLPPLQYRAAVSSRSGFFALTRGVLESPSILSLARTKVQVQPRLGSLFIRLTIYRAERHARTPASGRGVHHAYKNATSNSIISRLQLHVAIFRSFNIILVYILLSTKLDHSFENTMQYTLSGSRTNAPPFASGDHTQDKSCKIERTFTLQIGLACSRKGRKYVDAMVKDRYGVMPRILHITVRPTSANMMHIVGQDTTATHRSCKSCFCNRLRREFSRECCAFHTRQILLLGETSSQEEVANWCCLSRTICLPPCRCLVY